MPLILGFSAVKNSLLLLSVLCLMADVEAYITERGSARIVFRLVDELLMKSFLDI